MALIRLKRGTTAGYIPTGLTWGEPAVNTTDAILFCGNTYGNTIDLSGVLSFNGLTGHITHDQIDDALTLNVVGLSASAGITGNSTLYAAAGVSFGSDLTVDGNIILSEDSEVSIGGDTEKITFNGESARIDISAGTVMIDQYIGHAGDPDTWQRFQTDQWTLKCGGTEIIDAHPTYVGISGGLSASAGITGNSTLYAGETATFGGNIVVPDDAWIGVASDQERIVFDSNSNDITIQSATILIPNKLQHLNDSDTFLDFTTNKIGLEAGGVEFMSSVGTGGIDLPVGLSASGASQLYGGVTFGNDIYMGGDYHFRNEEGESVIDFASGRNLMMGDNDSAGNGCQIFIRDSHDMINMVAGDNINMDTPLLQVEGDVRVDGALVHRNDTNTKLDFTTDTISLLAGGVTFAEGNATNLHLPVGITASAGIDVTGTVTATGISASGPSQLYGGATFGNDIYMGGDYHVRNSAGASIIDFEGGRNIGFGDNDSAGNDTKISIRDSHTQINMEAGTKIDLDSPAVYIPDALIHTGDTNTKLDFTTDTISLLAGGVTGQAITTAGTNFLDTDVVRPNLKDYSETVNDLGTITGDTTIRFDYGNVQTVTGNGDCLFTLMAAPASGKAGTLTLIITNGGANTTTWHSSIKWPGDNAPALSDDGVDIVSFMTIDAGTTIYGFVGGINFS